MKRVKLTDKGPARTKPGLRPALGAIVAPASASVAAPEIKTPILSRVIEPEHYKAADSAYEHFRVVRAWKCSYCLGCATKYICRAGRKPGVAATEDLRKAIRYIEMEIENITVEAQK